MTNTKPKYFTTCGLEKYELSLAYLLRENGPALGADVVFLILQHANHCTSDYSTCSDKPVYNS